MNKDFMKYKPANTFLKPEDVQIGKCYAFSYNPISQPKIGRINSVKEWYDIYTKFFGIECMKGSTYQLYVEISSTGRFHFHGIIKILDRMNFYTNDTASLIGAGTSAMKEIESDEIWEKYIMKQQFFIQPYLQLELYGPFFKLKSLIRIT
jgi:hypothetical protein